jgi:predicted dienelactone hydrolase
MHLKRSLFVLALLLAAACASAPKDDTRSDVDTPRAERLGYGAETGPHPVGIIPAAVLRDAKRGKDLEMSIEYPNKAGTYPVIIFSHGYGGSSRGYVGLSSYWASNGYVVIKPTHADSGRAQTLRDAADVWENQTQADYRNRAADIIFIIDSLNDLQDKYPELREKIDREKVGVGGHSYGALTALMVGGAKLAVGGTMQGAADSRVDAIVAMSPQGTQEQIGLTAQSWTDVRVPALFLTGTRDIGPSEQDPSWRREPFESSPAGDKWFVSIPGARHFTFAGRFSDPAELNPRDGSRRPDPEADPRDPIPPTADPRRTPDPDYGRQTDTQRNQRGGQMFTRERGLFQVAKSTSLAFWDTYLKLNEEGRKQLESLRTRQGYEVATK